MQTSCCHPAGAQDAEEQVPAGSWFTKLFLQIVWAGEEIKTTGARVFTFTVPMAGPDITLERNGVYMAEILMHKDILQRNNPEKLQQIRRKFREVFGSDITMRDEALQQRYALSGDGDLIMILK